MGTILVPLFAHYRSAAPLVQAAYAEGLHAGYGSAEMIRWLVDERGIEPHVKLMDSPSDPTGRRIARRDRLPLNRRRRSPGRVVKH
jgi:hypothetical protein